MSQGKIQIKQQSTSTVMKNKNEKKSEPWKQKNGSHHRIPYLAGQCLHLSIAQSGIAEHNKKKSGKGFAKQKRTKKPLVITNQKVMAATHLPEASVTAVHCTHTGRASKRFFQQISYFKRILSNLTGPKQKWSLLMENQTSQFVHLLIKKLLTGTVVEDSCVPRHISPVKKLSGLFKLGLVTITDYWGHS